MALIDLHIHSNHSDGEKSPADLVAMAADQGLKAVALTDHDSVAGINEAATAGIDLGVEVIPGIELSVQYRHYDDVHLLGYFIEHHEPHFTATIQRMATARTRRAYLIIEKINARLKTQGKTGLLDADEIIAESGASVGRPHIARALLAKGLARDMEDAFIGYLGPCNVPKEKFLIGDAIKEIHRVGGLAVLAHPTTVSNDLNELRQIVRDLCEMGIDGLEVFTNLCYKDETLLLESLSERHGLIATGGSDFHGFGDDNRIGTGRGNLAIPYAIVEKLKMRKHARRDQT